jgi:glycosyltransferase involved in cell wall biosynthesis
VDILVAVPTHNHGQTVGPVVQAVRAGLLQYFPRARAVIINADGGSSDGTQDLVRAASINDANVSSDVRALRTLHSISTQYQGGPTSGAALHTILAAADLLQARACAVVSPESTTLEPQWVERLLRPLLSDGRDLVLPVYRRHKFDGLLIQNLAYPLTRAIYRCHVREPYPSDFGFSGALGSHFLVQDIWENAQSRRGTELWLTLLALVEKFKVVQAFLGNKARLENPRLDLVNAMRGTAGTLFQSMDSYGSAWTAGREALEAPCQGCEPGGDLEPLRLNRKRLYEAFRLGAHELEPVFFSILSAETHGGIRQLATAPEDSFVYSAELWTRTVYEFAAAYHKAVIDRDHIVQALVPLFRGRAFTFLTENHEATSEVLESNIEALCQTFESEKPYLLKLWGGGK